MRTATDEISACGCYIETMFTIDVDTKIDLVFSVNGERIRIKAVVATKYPQVGNGLALLWREAGVLISRDNTCCAPSSTHAVP